MRYLVLFIFTTLFLFADEKVAIPAYVAITALLIVIALFFWGIYKAVKSQKLIYTVALLPFVILIFWMFFI